MSERYRVLYSSELYHHGIKGQRWGVRRFQNYDGTRTTAGKKRKTESKPLTQRQLQKVIRSGNARDVRKHAPEMERGQLDEAMYRVNQDVKLGQIIGEKKNVISTGMKVVGGLTAGVIATTKLVNAVGKHKDAILDIIDRLTSN